MPLGKAVSGRAVERGFTLMALLALMAVISLGLAVAGPRWADQSRRARERELLRIGVLYAHALSEYRESSPGSLKTYPKSLDELVLDRRFVDVRRHLRRLYSDPLDPTKSWGVVRDIDGYIVGVYSQNSDEPVAGGAQTLGGIELPSAKHYYEWKFAPVIPS